MFYNFCQGDTKYISCRGYLYLRSNPHFYHSSRYIFRQQFYCYFSSNFNGRFYVVVIVFKPLMNICVPQWSILLISVVVLIKQREYSPGSLKNISFSVWAIWFLPILKSEKGMCDAPKWLWWCFDRPIKPQATVAEILRLQSGREY